LKTLRRRVSPRNAPSRDRIPDIDQAARDAAIAAMHKAEALAARLPRDDAETVPGVSGGKL
jgi:hypothetical protein